MRRQRLDSTKARHHLQKAQEGSLLDRIKSSINPVIASIIIVYLLILIVYFANYTPKKIQAEALQKDMDIVAKSFVSSVQSMANEPGLQIQESRIGQDGKIDKEKLVMLAKKNYAELKSELGIKNDFCIHFEDEQGNLIDISPITKRGGIGIGSPSLEFRLVDNSGNEHGAVSC